MYKRQAFASVQQDVISAAGSNGNINVQVNDDTVVLTGYVDDTLSRETAARVAEKQGFEVENHLLIND